MSFGVVSFVLSAASAIYQYSEGRKAAKAAKKAADERKGFEIAVEGEIDSYKVVYGRGRIAGARVFHKVASDYQYASPGAATAFLSSGGEYPLDNYSLGEPVTGVKVTLFDTGSGLLAEPPIGEAWTSSNTVTHEEAFTARTLSRVDNAANLAVTIDAGLAAYFLPDATVAFTHNPMDAPSGVIGRTLQLALYEGNAVSYSYKVLSYDNITGLLMVETPYVTGGVTNPSADALSASATGSRREYLIVGQAVCYEGISGAYFAEVDDKDYRDSSYKDSIRIHFYKDGGQSDALLTVNDTSQSTSLYPEMAHASMVFKLNRDEPQFSGVPNVAFYLEGMKIRNTITEAGGVYTLENTLSYSNNSAMVLLDYLLNGTYGLGLSISEVDLETFSKAAAICGKLMLVNGSTTLPVDGHFWRERIGRDGGVRSISRFEANFIVDTKNDVRENVKKLVDTMTNAKLVWSDGVYKLNLMYPVEYLDADSYLTGEVVQAFYEGKLDLFRAMSNTTGTAPSVGTIGSVWERGGRGLVAAYLTDDDLILDGDIAVKWPDLKDRFNHCSVKFLNESKDFKEDVARWPRKHPEDVSDVVYETYLEEDNGLLLESEYFKDGVTNYHQALSFAEETVRRSREAIQTSFTLSREFLYLEPGDVVQLDSTVLNTSGELLLLSGTKINDNNNLELEGERFDCRHFAWNAPDNEIVEGYNHYLDENITQASNLQYIPLATGDATLLKAGTLTWTAAEGRGTVMYEVRALAKPLFAVLPGDPWIVLGQTAGTSFDIPVMTEGLYTLTVVARSSEGFSAPEYNTQTGSSWPLLQINMLLDPLVEYRETVKIYKCSVTDIAGVVPTGGSMDFLGLTLAPPAGYYLTAAAAVANSGDLENPGDVYSSQAFIRGTRVETTVAVTSWSPLVLDNPENSFKDLVVFARADSVPSTPSGGSYTFPEGPLSPPSGWFVDPPATGGSLLYISKAGAIGKGQYGLNVNTLVWSAPAVYSSDGIDGTSGVTITEGNSNHTFFADETGAADASEFSNDFTVYRGTDVLTYDDTVPYSADSYRYGVVNSSNVTPIIDAGGQITISSGSALMSGSTSTGYITVEVIDNTTGLTLGDYYISLTKVSSGLSGVAGVRGSGKFTFEEDASAYITAANATAYTGTIDTSAAQGVAAQVIAESADGYIRPNDLVTVADASAELAGTRVYTGAATNSSLTVSSANFSSLVVEVIDGSLVVNGTLSADALAADTVLTNALKVQSNLTLGTNGGVGVIRTPLKTSMADTDHGFYLEASNVPGDVYTRLHLGDAGGYLQFDSDTGIVKMKGLQVVDAADNIIMASGSGMDWDAIVDGGGTRPADNATVGADWDTNVLNKPSGLTTTYYQAAAPGSPSLGDFWIDTDDDKYYRYSGSVWELVQDTDIQQALSDAATAQGTADSKVLTFAQASQPTGSLGDIWIDTDDGNKLYRYNGSSWVAVDDGRIATALSDASNAQSTADGKIQSFYQTAEPSAGMSSGDIWIDTDAGNKQYRYDGSSWVDIQDSSITAAQADATQAILDAATAEGVADGKATTFVQATAPTAEGVGDLWMDTDDSNKLYRWDGASWIAYSQDYADWTKIVNIPSNIIETYYQASAPGSANTGDFWIDSDDDKTYRYNGSAWVLSQDSDVAAAISAAAGAQATADGRVSTFVQNSAPTANATGDLWLDADDNYNTYRWSGSAWVDINGDVVGSNNKITAANISTYMSSLAVDTLYLASQAVTIPSSAYSSGSVGFSTTTTWVVAQTITYTSTGAPANVVASIIVRNPTGSFELFGLRIRRGTTTLWETTGQGMRVHSGEEVAVTAAIGDIPSSGSTTYTIEIIGESGFSTMYADRRSLTVTEMKK